MWSQRTFHRSREVGPSRSLCVRYCVFASLCKCVSVLLCVCAGRTSVSVSVRVEITSDLEYIFNGGSRMMQSHLLGLFESSRDQKFRFISYPSPTKVVEQLTLPFVDRVEK